MKKLFSFVGRYFNRAGFLLIQLSVFTVFLVPFSWFDFWLFLVSYGIGIFGISAGFHRLLSHRSYGASRIFRFVVTAMACTSVQKSPLWWALMHVLHHKHTDTPNDPHSPYFQGSYFRRFWHSHIGWIFVKQEGEDDFRLIKYLTKHWEMWLLHYAHMVPPLILAGICYALDGWSGVVWGFVVRTFVLYHSTFSVNSVCHMPYMGGWKSNPKDESRNNPLVAPITLGEGWHSDHHIDPARTKQGNGWWKFDPTFYILWTLEKLTFRQLVWGVWKPFRPPHSRSVV